MRSIYIRLQLGPAAAPLIVHMHTRLRGVAIVCDYLHPALAKVEYVVIGDIEVEQRHLMLSFNQISCMITTVPQHHTLVLSMSSE